MYSRILVTLDGSEAAEEVLPYVRYLGEGLQSRIEILRVIGPLPPELPASLPEYVELEQVVTNMVGHARSGLEKNEKAMTDLGLTVTSRVIGGSVVEQIVSQAEAEPGTLVAMCTHGKSGTSFWPLGSVTGRVLQAINEPMLIVRSRQQTVASEAVRLSTIIVPLDGSAASEEVLPYVIALAKPIGMKVILIRIVPTLWEYHYGEPSTDANQQATEYLQTVSQNLAQQGIESVEELVLHGDPAESILEAAQRSTNTLIAMATHGSSGIQRWSLGSVTFRVVQYSGDPLLVIRAHGKR